MYFKLLSYLGRFRKQAILAPLAVIGEVALEIYIPFLMARIIDIGIAQKNVPYIVETGLLMIAAAVVSLACGAGCRGRRRFRHGNQKGGVRKNSGFFFFKYRPVFNGVFDYAFNDGYNVCSKRFYDDDPRFGAFARHAGLRDADGGAD